MLTIRSTTYSFPIAALSRSWQFIPMAAPLRWQRSVGKAAQGCKPSSVLRVRFKTSSRITELSQHETNGREFQECEGVSVEIFPVLGEAAATVEPGNGAFDNPTLG